MQEQLKTKDSIGVDLDSLRSICGNEHVINNAEDIEFYSQDVYERGAPLGAIVRPASTEEIVEIVKLAKANHTPIYARGGGMSYTRAYLADKPGAILIDTSRLIKIRDMNVEDGYITVDSGCTWKQIDEALAAHGARATFWGPFSGKTATVGGSMSQGSATFGSGQASVSATTALGFEVVTGNGEIIRTGLDAQAGKKPFFRHYGPDLTGLMTGDAGALGIKTGVTLALEKRAEAIGGVSFAFKSFNAVLNAMSAAAKSGLASEIIAMDSAISGIQAGEASLKEDLKKALAIVKAAPNLPRGLLRGAKAAISGRKVYTESEFTAHFICDATSAKLLDVKSAELRRVVAPFGDEIANAPIGVIRADPFPDLPLAHFDGRRMLPIHGLLQPSRVQAFHDEYMAYVESVRPRMEAAKVSVVFTHSYLGKNCFLYEPVWYWEDALDEFHKRMSAPGMLDAAQTYQPNPEGAALVEEMRVASIQIMEKYGAGHLQIGRAYPYLQDRAPETISLLRSVKNEIDPDNIINPGALGLEP